MDHEAENLVVSMGSTITLIFLLIFNISFEDSRHLLKGDDIIKST